MKQRLRGRRLLLRVYLYGIFMLALSAGATFLVGRYVLRRNFDAPPRPSTAWIAAHMASLRTHPAELAGELSDLKRQSGIELTLFDEQRRVLASNAAVPPPAPDPDELKDTSAGRGRFENGASVLVAEALPGRPRILAVVRHPSFEFPWSLAAVQLGAVLLVLALASIPLARSISAPVEALAGVTRAFGAGDLSARVRSARKDELGELSRAFDEMADRIAYLRRSEKELLANVSHELRTPLTRIRLALELASDGDAAKARAYVESISEELQELEGLLDDVMTSARLDLAENAAREAAPPLRLERTRVSELVQASEARFRARHPGRTLLVRGGADELGELVLDKALFRRAVDNLLDNAVKFSDASESVELSAERGKRGELVLSVADRGIGVAPEDLPRLFTPFFRGDRSRTRETGGVGLGLTVCKRVVEAHGGTVRAEPGEEVGTRFVIEVPAA